VVLRHCLNTKSLSFISVWEVLALLMVKQARPSVGCRTPLRFLLCPDLGALPLGIRPLLETPHLDSPYVRRRSRSPPVGADAMGCLGHGPLGSMGRISGRWRPGRKGTVALAWRAGRGPGCRIWYDPTANADEISHHIHIDLRPSFGLSGYHRRESMWARWKWAGSCLP